MFIRQQQTFHSFPGESSSLNQQLSELHHEIKNKVPLVDRVSFSLYDSHLDMLRTYATSEVSENPSDVHQDYPLADCPSLKECAEKHLHRVINNIAATASPHHRYAQWLIDQGYQSSFSVPTYHHQQFIGFINFNSFEQNVFSPEVQSELMPFCELINYTINSEYSLVHSILTSAELTREIYPGARQDSDQHISRISLFSRLIAIDLASAYGLEDETIEHIHLFSRLHDIGKITIPDAILLKPTPLTPDERKIMQSHIDKGLMIIDKILDNLGSPDHPCVHTLKEIITCHHEFLDGSGYPNALKGEEIPISARIVTVANVFDALTSHRPYQQAWCIPSALLEMEKMVAMGKLDGHCVNVLRDHQEYIAQILSQYPEQDPRECLVQP